MAFTNKESLVGEPALNQEARNRENTIFDVKRLIGRSFTEPEVQKYIKRWPFKVIEGPDGEPEIDVTFKNNKIQLKSEGILSMLLANMRERASEYL